MDSFEIISSDVDCIYIICCLTGSSLRIATNVNVDD